MWNGAPRTQACVRPLRFKSRPRPLIARTPALPESLRTFTACPMCSMRPSESQRLASRTRAQRHLKDGLRLHGVDATVKADRRSIVGCQRSVCIQAKGHPHPACRRAASHLNQSRATPKPTAFQRSRCIRPVQACSQPVAPSLPSDYSAATCQPCRIGHLSGVTRHACDAALD